MSLACKRALRPALSERVTPAEVPTAANELLPEIGNKLKHVERKGGCPPTSDLSERVTPTEVPIF